MHILYFHQHFTTPKGASGIRSYENARRLVEEGHRVTMVCGSADRGATGLEGPFKGGRREGDVDGIHVVEYDLSYSNSDGFLKRSWTFLRFALKSIGLALMRKYDLLFATTTPLTAALPGIFAKWLRRKPFVFEVRDLWPELPREMGVITNPVVLWAMGVLEWMAYHSADRLVALSPGIAKGIERRGIAEDRIVMVPNGCDLALFSGAEPERPAGVGADELVAIFAGAHGLANGLDSVLDGAAELKRRGRRDIRILLVGNGMLKPKLQARAQAEGLDNVTFLDPVPKGELVKLFAGADIGIQSLANVPAFYYGTSPNKFFDYVAAGLPVINNYPGWVAGMIEEEGAGYAVAPDDPAAFADALEAAAADRAGLKAKGEAAKRLARREFARDDLAKRWIRWTTEGAR
ncbi:glycosyltransferase family 4 protein [Sphingomicrobium flavum]|uniref:glycosyltransferase family 4 protein n=1 Tax=Sphingomicrobium flavum TaxID=1229164 RepID=UPI0021AD66C5|nr:glycosyltransferase family 4 protein [Sphingomicrobium flavum]